MIVIYRDEYEALMHPQGDLSFEVFLIKFFFDVLVLFIFLS